MLEKILHAAIVLAERPGGLMLLTRDMIAQQAKCAPGLVSYYFGDMDNLRSQLIAHAIHTTNLIIIGQAVALKLPEVTTLSARFKTKALMSLV